MKKSLLLLLTASLLASCNGDSSDDSSNNEQNNSESNLDYSSENENSSKENLIDKSSLTKGVWIGASGSENNNDNMLLTETIKYDSSNQYQLIGNAYVAFYNDNNFIETVRYQGSSEDFPYEVETVENANNIRISYFEKWEDDILLTKK